MQPGPGTKKNIIFLCSYNSVRSQIAEGFMRSLAGDRYNVYSAGIAKGGISPYAIKVMKESGIDISHQTSKSVREFRDIPFDITVTLCDDSKDTLIRYLPDGGTHIHHHIQAVSEVGADEEEILRNFRSLRDEIKTWIKTQFA